MTKYKLILAAIKYILSSLFAIIVAPSEVKKERRLLAANSCKDQDKRDKFKFLATALIGIMLSLLTIGVSLNSTPLVPKTDKTLVTEISTYKTLYNEISGKLSDTRQRMVNLLENNNRLESELTALKRELKLANEQNRLLLADLDEANQRLEIALNENIRLKEQAELIRENQVSKRASYNNIRNQILKLNKS